jgi:hypothetical protein
MVQERLEKAKGYLESVGGVEGKRLQSDRRRKKKESDSHNYTPDEICTPGSGRRKR